MLLEYVLVIGSQSNIILSTQQLIDGGNKDATESHNVYQSLCFEQYQWFTEGLFNLASRRDPPVPGIITTGFNPYAKFTNNEIMRVEQTNNSIKFNFTMTS